MTVSSMSETMPNFAVASITWINVSTGSVPSARRTAVCQPGESLTSTTVSISPPRSALTCAVTSPMVISTPVYCMGTLVKARQPRTFWVPLRAAW